MKVPGSAPATPPTGAPATDPAPRRVRDRDVILLLAAVVVAVLAVNFLSAAIPGVDRILAVAPILVLVLLIGTGYVLFRAIRPRS